MIKEQEDGRWLATCDICSWKTMEKDKENAKNRLKNHINIVHKKGRKRIEKEKAPLPEKKPPQIPSPINEQS